MKLTEEKIKGIVENEMRRKDELIVEDVIEFSDNYLRSKKSIKRLCKLVDFALATETYHGI